MAARFGLLQIVNMTEQELKRVDVRVGLIGALRFMDGSPQGVRQLHHLHSQVGPVHTLLSIWAPNFTRILESVEFHEGDTVLGRYWNEEVERGFVPQCSTPNTYSSGNCGWLSTSLIALHLPYHIIVDSYHDR